MSIDIEADNVDVGNMVLAAKYGNWDEVFEVLDRKPNLISCIPQERAWGVLHQAVHWNRHDIINRLLKKPACDVLIKTKPCRFGDIPPSSTPIDIARHYGYTDIEATLDYEEKYRRHQRFNSIVPYTVSRIAGEKVFDKLPLFLLEVTMYKHSLVKPHTDVKLHMIDLMKKILDNETNNWKQIEAQVHNALYGFSRVSAEAVMGANTEEKYFEELIRLYTADYVHREVNEALAREFIKDYKPTAEDLALGLYALLLDITIAFWNKIKAVTQTTYRGVKVDVTDRYEVDKVIMVTTILSSSKSEAVAKGFRGGSGTLFIFDNTAESPFRPRDIEDISLFPWEEECVYAVGSEFKVTSVDNRERVVKLTLIK